MTDNANTANNAPATTTNNAPATTTTNTAPAASTTNNANSGGAKKPEEPKPHPVFVQLPGVQYCVNSPPPWLVAVGLGFQHYLLALGMIVLIPSILVPQMGGGVKEKAKVIQTLLFVSGVNTLLHSFFGTRLPSVIGGSYAFVITATSIIHDRRHRAINLPELRFLQTMRDIQGALIISSCFLMFVGFIGLWRNIMRLFTPLSMVPLVTFSGLGLYHLGFPLISKCLAVGLPELVFIIIISQYLPIWVKQKKPLCDRFALLLSVAIVWFYASVLTWTGAFKKSENISCRTDGSGLVSGAPWFYVPYPFQWGSPTFRTKDIFAAIVASFVAATESTGSFIAAARYGSATPIPPPVISRGVGWLGVGTMLNAVFGGVTGSMATIENAGLLSLTKVGSRSVIQISSLFMILFSVLGKFGAIFASIPTPIMAASYCIYFGYVSSAGIGLLQFCNLNSSRTKLVLGLSFFIGLSLPQYFILNKQSPGWFTDIVGGLLMSPASVAAIIALVLDCTLPVASVEARKDNGSHWWEKFMVYTKDVRNDEFYKLPGPLNRCFPAA